MSPWNSDWMTAFASENIGSLRTKDDVPYHVVRFCSNYGTDYGPGVSAIRIYCTAPKNAGTSTVRTVTYSEVYRMRYYGTAVRHRRWVSTARSMVRYQPCFAGNQGSAGPYIGTT